MNVQPVDPPCPKRDSTMLEIPITFDTERAIQEAQSKFEQELFFACLGQSLAQAPCLSAYFVPYLILNCFVSLDRTDKPK